jgi:hypothetical protein
MLVVSHSAHVVFPSRVVIWPGVVAVKVPVTISVVANVVVRTRVDTAALPVGDGDLSPERAPALGRKVDVPAPWRSKISCTVVVT